MNKANLTQGEHLELLSVHLAKIRLAKISICYNKNNPKDKVINKPTVLPFILMVKIQFAHPGSHLQYDKPFSRPGETATYHLIYSESLLRSAKQGRGVK